MAISTSAALEFGAVAKTCPVAGLTKSVVLPDLDSTLFPFMKLLNFSMERDYALTAKKCSSFPVTSSMFPWEIRQKQAFGGVALSTQPSLPGIYIAIGMSSLLVVDSPECGPRITFLILLQI
jgi:hypothetical protein